MKQIFKVVTVFTILILYLGSCGKDDSKQDKLKLAIAMPGFSAISGQWLVTGAREYVSQNSNLNIDLIVTDAQGDAELSLAQIETIVSQGVKGVFVVPTQLTLAVPMFTILENANIPFIAKKLSDPELISRLTTYVGSDDYEAGVIQAEMAVEALNYKGNIAIIHGGYGSSPQVLRNQGYKDVFAKYPNIEVIIEQEAPQWTTGQGLEITENWILSGRKIDAILTMSDTIAMGALVAVENAGVKDKIKVYGIDALPSALQAIKDGRLDGTVWQDMFNQGWYGVDILYRVAQGETIKNPTLIPFEEVNIHNIDEFLARAKKRDELNAKYFK